MAIGIEFQAVYADYPVIAICGAERVTVIDDVEFIISSDNTVVTGSSAMFPIALENGADSLERSIGSV